MDDEQPQGSEPRSWILSLSARSAVRFKGRQRLVIGLDPAKARGCEIMVVEDEWCYSGDARGDEAPQFVGGLSLRAIGKYASVTDALENLNHVAAPQFQMMAVAANAAVGEPGDIVVYAPPVAESEQGEFLIQRHANYRMPAEFVRKLEPQHLMDVFNVFNAQSEKKKARIGRATAHYRMALSHLDPLNRVLAAESLWMAVENLQEAVIRRLREEAGLPSGAAGLNQLAAMHGFAPAVVPVITREMAQEILEGKQVNLIASNPRHLNDFRGYVRRTMIFDEDTDCYDNLREMSDAFEHGYGDFGEVQKLSRSADAAFTYVRRSILREMGLANDHPLLESKWDQPLGYWNSVLQASGKYKVGAFQPIPVNDASMLDTQWPDRPDFQAIPIISNVVDTEEGKRTLQVKLTQSSSALGHTFDFDEIAIVRPMSPDLEVDSETSANEKPAGE